MIRIGITKDMALRLIRNHSKLTEKIVINSEALKELLEEGRVKKTDEDIKRTENGRDRALRQVERSEHVHLRRTADVVRQERAQCHQTRS